MQPRYANMCSENNTKDMSSVVCFGVTAFGRLLLNFQTRIQMNYIILQKKKKKAHCMSKQVAIKKDTAMAKDYVFVCECKHRLRFR